MPPSQPDQDGLPPESKAIRWYKSSYSNYNGNCVEAARLPGGSWAVRDSKSPDRAILLFGPEGWGSFIRAIKRRDFEI
jgi:hypothetical protein